jgi:hypothetical protein
MIRRCDERDLEVIWTIINHGALAYKGTIPSDRWTEPYELVGTGCGKHPLVSVLKGTTNSHIFGLRRLYQSGDFEDCEATRSDRECF